MYIMEAGPAVDGATPSGGSSNGVTRIGRPPHWTPSKSRKLARLYTYSTLPLEKLLQLLFPDGEVRKNSAQKTLNKMLGRDPRRLRPETREDMNQRFKWLHKSHGSGSKVHTYEHDEVVKPNSPELKVKLQHSPSSSEAQVQPRAQSVAASLEFVPPAPVIRRQVTRGKTPKLRLDTDPSSGTTTTTTITGEVLVTKIEQGELDSFNKPPFAPPLRHDTIFTTSTVMSSESVQQIRSAMEVSPAYAKQLNILMKRMTISTPLSSNLSPQCAWRATPEARSGSPQPCIPGPHSAIPNPGLATPGDFMVANRYQQKCDALKHFKDSLCQCWCCIADDISSPDNFYFYANGEPSERAMNVRDGLANPVCADQFGNTPIHLLAAMDVRQGQYLLLDLLVMHPDPLALNTARQSPLHVLDATWFLTIDDQGGPLSRLLSTISIMRPHAVYERDVYGRTFFHRARACIQDHQVFARLCRPFNQAMLSRRDAHGIELKAMINRDSASSLSAIVHSQAALSSHPVPGALDEDAEARHRNLLHMVGSTFEHPWNEDAQGRNGLQCLAELDFHYNPAPGNSTGCTPARKPSKRKRGKQDSPEPESATLRKLTMLDGLLNTTKIAPNVNHWDKSGTTVLMSFVENLPDSTDDKMGSVASILDLLIDKSISVGDAILETRNRRGETAVLVAARCGHILCLSRLVERGANVNVRDRNGRGIMALVDARISQSRSAADLPTYGKLEAVRAVMAKQLEERGVVSEPGLVDEWALVRNRI